MMQQLSWLLLMLHLVAVAMSAPFPHPPTTSAATLSTPPTNLTACESSNFCNYGACDLATTAWEQRVSCTCIPPFVDSSAGLCTVQGKSKRTAFLLRCPATAPSSPIWFR